MKLAKVTRKDLVNEWGKVTNYFKERETYKVDLRNLIDKHGLSNLSTAILRTVPTDLKVLREKPWYWHISVWARIIQITFLNAQNEGMKRAYNG